MKNSILKDQSFASDFVGGALAGAFTGAIVAPVEALKIECQLKTNQSIKTILRDYSTRTNMLKTIPSFATIFSAVCALEFSVNERIKHNYGQVAGVTASALTGAGFLTLADHLMLKRQHKESPYNAVKNLYKIGITAPWTGFYPMVARESIFITSVMYLGPNVGKRLNSGQDQNSLFWNSVGRLITGVTTTLISQPFDTMAREMQQQLHKEPKRRPTLLNCYKSLTAKLQEGSHLQSIRAGKHPFLKGAIPRTGLATFGGVLAGGFFQHFKDSMQHEHEVATKSNSYKHRTS